MRAILISAIVAASVGGIANADPTADALSAKAEECIKAAAPRVAANSQGLTDAVNFLVNDLCGVEIQHANTYSQSTRALEQLKAVTASAQLAGVTIDPATGELNTPPGFAAPLNTTNIMLNALRPIAGQAGQFRSVAAKAVLAARAK